MITIQNRQKLLSLLQDFYQLSGIRVGVFDPNGRELVAYPQKGAAYCEAIGKADTNRAACRQCDWAAYQQAALTQDIHIYRCHAGLVEAIVPIKSHGLSYGYLMMGQLRPDHESDADKNKRLAHLKTFGLDPDAINALYHVLPAHNTAHINAYAHILQACASYVWMEDYVKLKEAPLSYKIENYIRTHLEQKITIADLTAYFQVGKTTLCNTVKEETGFSVTELIRSIRIEEAETLLQKENLSVGEVAARVGIEDYNYFSKVFKQITGKSPSAFRQVHAVQQSSQELI